jgi:hypothetical protein
VLLGVAEDETSQWVALGLLEAKDDRVAVMNDGAARSRQQAAAHSRTHALQMIASPRFWMVVSRFNLERALG